MRLSVVTFLVLAACLVTWLGHAQPQIIIQGDGGFAEANVIVQGGAAAAAGDAAGGGVERVASSYVYRGPMNLPVLKASDKPVLLDVRDLDFTGIAKELQAQAGGRYLLYGGQRKLTFVAKPTTAYLVVSALAYLIGAEKRVTPDGWSVFAQARPGLLAEAEGESVSLEAAARTYDETLKALTTITGTTYVWHEAVPPELKAKQMTLGFTAIPKDHAEEFALTLMGLAVLSRDGTTAKVAEGMYVPEAYPHTYVGSYAIRVHAVRLSQEKRFPGLDFPQPTYPLYIECAVDAARAELLARVNRLAAGTALDDTGAALAGPTQTPGRSVIMGFPLSGPYTLTLEPPSRNARSLQVVLGDLVLYERLQDLARTVDVSKTLPAEDGDDDLWVRVEKIEPVAAGADGKGGGWRYQLRLKWTATPKGQAQPPNLGGTWAYRQATLRLLDAAGREIIEPCQVHPGGTSSSSADGRSVSVQTTAPPMAPKQQTVEVTTTITTTGPNMARAAVVEVSRADRWGEAQPIPFEIKNVPLP